MKNRFVFRLFRLPMTVAAVAAALLFTPPAEAKDKKDKDKHSDHRDDHRDHRDRDRHHRGYWDSHRWHGHGYSHFYYRRMETRSCSSHRHHHSHVWHSSRSHRDYRCPGHR